MHLMQAIYNFLYAKITKKKLFNVVQYKYININDEYNNYKSKNVRKIIIKDKKLYKIAKLAKVKR